MLNMYFCLNKQHIKHCGFCVLMEVQKMERECTILRKAVVKVVLYKDRDCSPGILPGLFFQAKPNKDSNM